MNQRTLFERTLLERMNQELLLTIDSNLKDLSLVIAMAKVLKGKDSLSQEERFNDDIYQQIDNVQSILIPYFKKATPDDKAFHNILMDSEVIPLNLMNDIDETLSFREDSYDISSSPFSPYYEDKESFTDAKEEFFLRLLILYRVKAWLNDIIYGIQDYGVDPYKVMEGDSEERINLLDGVYDLTEEQVIAELRIHLLVRDDDGEEAVDKQSQAVLLSELLAKKTIKKGDEENE